MDNGLHEQSKNDMANQVEVELSFHRPVRSNDGNEGNELGLTFNGPVQRNELQLSDVGCPKVDQASSEFPETRIPDAVNRMKRVSSFSNWIDNARVHQDGYGDSDHSSDEDLNSDFSLRPSLSQNQLFSIHDFSPKWAYANSVTEVHITGTFLMAQQDVLKYQWSCMFGEIEVPAQVLVDGVLCCYAPSHTAANVSFCVTCSNKLACSEEREFCFRVGSTEDVGITSIHDSNQDAITLHLQLEKILSLKSLNHMSNIFDGEAEKLRIVNKIISLKDEHGSYQMEDCALDKCLSKEELQRQFLKKLVEEKLYSWLLHKVTETGNGPRVLDDKGQGVLHLVAALGYDWAIRPTLMAGVPVNFRDINGWTALHWAAFYGRERTVAVLLSADGAPGALTHPSCKFPLVVLPFFERKATPQTYDVMLNQDVLSLKDSLSAISNATQAAHRTYQMFRIQSFQKKKLTDGGIDVVNKSDEYAPLFSSTWKRKVERSYNLAHVSERKIHKIMFLWKKRKRFLIFPQRIIKKQAPSKRTRQSKKSKTFVPSVRILAKIILFWRHKGSWPYRICQRPLSRDFGPQCNFSEEEDDEFLKKGKNQNEQRIDNALSRVTSMIRHQEGQAQYRRLLIIAENFHKNKDIRAKNSRFSNFLGSSMSVKSSVGSCGSDLHSFAASRHSRSNSSAGSCTMDKDAGSETDTRSPNPEDADLAPNSIANSNCLSLYESTQLQNPDVNNANPGSLSSYYANNGSGNHESQTSVHGRSPKPHAEVDTSTDNSPRNFKSQNSESTEELWERDLWGHRNYVSTDSSSSSRTGGTLHVQI